MSFCKVLSNGTETSDAAAESMKPHAARVEAMVYAYIHSRGVHGSTSDEAEAALSLSHQCCSARFNRLASEEVGVIEKSGEKRLTRSGRAAYVYVAREFNRTPVRGNPTI